MAYVTTGQAEPNFKNLINQNILLKFAKQCLATILRKLHGVCDMVVYLFGNLRKYTMVIL